MESTFDAWPVPGFRGADGVGGGYRLGEGHFLKPGEVRVILCTSLFGRARVSMLSGKYLLGVIRMNSSSWLWFL